jgi:hypothetical protein
LGFVIFPPKQNGSTKGAVRKTVLDDFFVEFLSCTGIILSKAVVAAV